jgi:hypothetical protein
VSRIILKARTVTPTASSTFQKCNISTFVTDTFHSPLTPNHSSMLVGELLLLLGKQILFFIFFIFWSYRSHSTSLGVAPWANTVPRHPRERYVPRRVPVQPASYRIAGIHHRHERLVLDQHMHQRFTPERSGSSWSAGLAVHAG